MKFAMVIAALFAAALATAQQYGFNGPGVYEMMNVKSRRMMAMDMGDRNSVIQTSHGAENQRWMIEPGPEGSFFIRNATNGRALQITNNAKSTPVVVSRFDRNPTQQWRIEPGKDGNLLIVSAAGGRVLDIPDGSDREGLRIQIYDRDGDSNQRFIFHQVDERRLYRDRNPRERWERDR